MSRTSKLFLIALLPVFLFPFLFPFAANGQDPQDRQVTEAQLATLREEIRAEEARLAAAGRTEEASVGKINSLERQIDMREELVDTYRSRLGRMTAEQDSLFSDISRLESELDELREDYQRRATNAYRYGRLHDVALILSASSINEMLVRIQYLHRFSNTRQSRLVEMSDKTALLKERRTQLQRTLVRNQVLLSDTQEEQQTLSKLKQNKEVEVDRIRTQRDRLAQSLDEKRSSADQLNSKIRVLIADESSRRELTGSEATNALHAAETGTFLDKRGRMAWPVEGSLKEPFGEIINPEHGTRTNNLHVLIAAEASSEVKSVSSGRVSTIDVMPEYGRFILVEHGDYVTFYGNLSLFYAAAGDTIEAGQVIGRSGTDAEPAGPAIFFGVFEGGKAVDPEKWLMRK